MIYEPVFPGALQPAASALGRALLLEELAPSVRGFKVLVQGEAFSAPYRVYCRPTVLQAVIARSAGETRQLAVCLGTRHCDGYLREECLRELLAMDCPWAAPFIVQLLGEYVIEIVELVAWAVATLSVVDVARYSQFALENPAFMATTRRRATSYWNCYHRGRFPKLCAYPAIAALDAIERMDLGGGVVAQSR